MSGPVPRRFTWEGRAYVVADVLGHWVTGAAWWRAPAELGRASSALARGLSTRSRCACWPPHSRRGAIRRLR